MTAIATCACLIAFSAGKPRTGPRRQVAQALPALIQADYYAHIGGFITGLLLGTWLPVGPVGAAVLAPAGETGLPAGEGPEGVPASAPEVTSSTRTGS